MIMISRSMYHDRSFEVEDEEDADAFRWAHSSSGTRQEEHVKVTRREFEEATSHLVHKP